jgi:polynucleotide 5'-kinase involved in rRNA processing
MAASRQPYRRNPFKPTAGMNPPELIGRSDVLERFAESLENGPGAPDRLMRIAGVRGVGKTALLNALGNVAEQQGFRVVNVAASPGFMGRITSELGGSFSVGSVSIPPPRPLA